MNTGYVIGRIIGLFVFPLLVMSVVGIAQYIRTKDKKSARRAMFSKWSIVLGIVLLVLGIVGQMANNVESL